MTLTWPTVRWQGKTVAALAALGLVVALPLGARADGGSTLDPAGQDPPAGALQASTAAGLFREFLTDVGPAGLQAVVFNGQEFVIRLGGGVVPEGGQLPPGNGADAAVGMQGTLGEAERKARTFVSRFSNVRLEEDVQVLTQNGVFGGQGLLSNRGIACSGGFSAFDPRGGPALLTAGHCSSDGDAETAALQPTSWSDAVPLGTFGFSQFGGVGNAALTADQEVGTDISVIDGIAPGLDLRPAVTPWDEVGEPSAPVEILGIAKPSLGMPVCRSGWATGWSCGTVDEVGVYISSGPTMDNGDLRAFSGFLSADVQSAGGDSGGSWVSGHYAVGLHSGVLSAGGARIGAVAASLDDAMAVLPGYSLRLALNPPVLSTSIELPVQPGRMLAGSVPAVAGEPLPAGLAVRIRTRGTGTGSDSAPEGAFDVPVDAAGRWEFAVPQLSGDMVLTAQTVQGFSVSEPTEITLGVRAPGAGEGTAGPVPTVPDVVAPDTAVPDVVAPDTAVPDVVAPVAVTDGQLVRTDEYQAVLPGLTQGPLEASRPGWAADSEMPVTSAQSEAVRSFDAPTEEPAVEAAGVPGLSSGAPRASKRPEAAGPASGGEGAAVLVPILAAGAGALTLAAAAGLVLVLRRHRIRR